MKLQTRPGDLRLPGHGADAMPGYELPALAAPPELGGGSWPFVGWHWCSSSMCWAPVYRAGVCTLIELPHDWCSRGRRRGVGRTIVEAARWLFAPTQAASSSICRIASS